MAELLRRFGLWRCSRGHHARLKWLRAGQRRVPITNQPIEMMYASGLMRLAKWNGWCPRCDRAVEWATSKPRGVSGDGRGETP